MAQYYNKLSIYSAEQEKKPQRQGYILIQKINDIDLIFHSRMHVILNKTIKTSKEFKKDTKYSMKTTLTYVYKHYCDAKQELQQHMNHNVQMHKATIIRKDNICFKGYVGGKEILAVNKVYINPTRLLPLL